MGEYLIRTINIPIHIVLMLICWKCPPKFYVIHGPILTICASIPTLHLLNSDEPNSTDDVVSHMQVTFVQMSLAIITSLLTSGAYLLTSFSLLLAASIILIVRN